MANKRPVITATILPMTTVRNINGSDQNINIAKILIEKDGKQKLIQVKIRFDDAEVGQKLRLAMEVLIKK